ncbi:hypothetical protein POM88_026271 [Heracleum sosnowskyi]|uniref:Uncharacterized protein n=1 Tax=Heracleum sosnowskyi TaxID=360622 RepID=A0AAD8I7T7_9APIA|nr:hypothetical protein POM88_026271 [Heracleum sosnowskyi]
MDLPWEEKKLLRRISEYKVEDRISSLPDGDCYIRCPQLINLKIETRCYDAIEGQIVVLAPKLTNFTSVGTFPITFEDSKLDNVYIKLRGWIDPMNISKKTLKEYYRRFTIMLPSLGSAKTLSLQLETIEALSSISNFLVSSPSPFYNLKCVKLPHGFEEASLSSIVRSYLLSGSPTATIVATLPPVHADRVIPSTLVEGTCNDQVSSYGVNTY